MKRMKKIAGLVLALVVVLAMTITGLAAGNGTITVTGAEAGKKVEIYKVFDLTASADSKNVAYTIDSDWTEFFAAGGAGAVYIVGTNDTSANNGAGLNPIIVNGTTKYINITEANVQTFSNAALSYALTLNPDAEQTAAEGVTSITFTGLDLGYYLVYPVGATELSGDYSCVCSLTSAVPDGTVTIKAKYPTIEKTDDAADVEVGQTVAYEITGEVPNTTGFEKYIYKVTDTMTEGLTFDENITVTFGDTAIDLEADQAAGKVEISYANNGFVLNFDMTKYQDYAGQAITITYTATVNKKAVTVVSKNHAELEYSHNPGDETDTETTPPEEETVYSAKIIINKVDENDNKLAGAEFVLKNSEGKFYHYTAAADTAAAKVEWIDLSVSGEAPTLEQIKAAAEAGTITPMTSNAEGTASFDGLKNGTYTLVEIEAPAGYNLLDKEVSVVVSGTDADTATLTVTSDKIINKTGTVLPSTGGMGTTVIYIVGAVLVLGAVILLVTRRRMSMND